MKKLIEYKLKILAKMVLAKYKPDIIGITGSVGKTSAKEAIYSVLKAKRRVRSSHKNYNNEIGLPLTILGIDSPGRSVWGWMRVFFIGFKLIIIKDKDFPEVLILEMGVDRPGDMKYLTSIAKPKIAVITLVGQSHLEYFDSVEHISKEKSDLLRNISKNGWAIVYYDDETTRKMQDAVTAKILTYGFDQKATVRAIELNFSFEKEREIKNMCGMSFKLSYKGSTVPINLPDVIGYQAIYSALAAVAVGISYSMNMLEIASALKEMKSPKGRMTLIDGIKETMIIDDSYNSSPQSCVSALRLIGKIGVRENARKFAVLGDMLELGKYTEEGHKDVGKAVVASKMDKLIAVGERARDIARGAEEAGMLRDHIFRFPNPEEAGKFIQDRIRPGDLLLVKGSQGMRMEKIVKEIMARPDNAEYLLVRQDEEWLKK